MFNFFDTNKKFFIQNRPTIDKINSLETELENLSLEVLLDRSINLKNKIQDNTISLDKALIEAFALVREVAKRTLGQRHFDVQLLGGIALAQGKITEMKTGEGKTLAATLPTYLNALCGKGVHVVTVNDYLARRDTVWMGQIYYALGLSIGCITQNDSYIYDPSYTKENSLKDQSELDKNRDLLASFKVFQEYLRPCSKKEAYNADITYGTSSEFGFDYLRDNLVRDLKDIVQRGHYFAIIDEVDSILIDEARTPHIISQPDEESSKLYQDFALIASRLQENEDYEADYKNKTITLLESGLNKLEQILGKNIYDLEGIENVHHLEEALRAQTFFSKDKDYIVKDGKVLIVDEFTGRILPDRRYSGGLHQALEAKEHVYVNPESRTIATITIQNYFRMYEHICGMTGTALTSAEEFEKVYHLKTVAIPTNKPLIRVDLPDKIYRTQDGKYKAIIRAIEEKNKLGQPVLVGTRSVEINEKISSLLKIKGIPHNVLNAKYHEQEGQIIAQAGKKGAVTVATNMAGRGVDIILGGNPADPIEREEIVKMGGLFVLGTERHEARRIDNQLRGRAGRQGDPGSTQFFVSLDDELIKIFAPKTIGVLMERFGFAEDEAIEHPMITKAIETAQTKIEGINLDIRQHILEYDDVLNKQRQAIYNKRKLILSINQEQDLDDFVQSLNIDRKIIQEKKEKFGVDQFINIVKQIALSAIDSLWMIHLEKMDQLRDSVTLQSYAQKDPLVEYKRLSFESYQELLNRFNNYIVDFITKIDKEINVEVKPQTEVIGSHKKIGRNDPCPCGSGKKYKHCCGKNL
ncbi:MAG TPA: preprotein translocase subunit SecA [Candidatus Paceibacterota bacterium]|nr:preprotein translocase subunit SecA [Candidatus Paceibacterota bacterium]